MWRCFCAVLSACAMCHRLRCVCFATFWAVVFRYASPPDPSLLHFTLRHQRHRCAACCGTCPLHIAPMQTQRYTPPHYRSIALPMKWIHFKLYVFRRHPCSVPFQTRTATKNRTQQTHPFLASDQYVTLQLL